MDSAPAAIAATAARLVVEEGLDYGAAKRRAVKQLGLPPRTALPDNDVLEDEVRDYLALFHAETHPAELAALRRLALVWMQRLAAFEPLVSGAVWHGTATRLSDIHLQLLCDDPKSIQWLLINQHVAYESSEAAGLQGAAVEVLSFAWPCAELDGEPIGIHLALYDHRTLRGALKPDAKGRTPRGDAQALQRLLDNSAP